MPELPEVETVRRGLKKLTIGEMITKVEFDWAKSFPNPASEVDQFLIGSTIKDVRRRAKVLLIDLSSDYSLVIHLKMTGQMVFVGAKAADAKTSDRFGAGHPNDSLIGQLPDKSTRVTLAMKSGAQLFFNDQRKFGWMRLIPTIQIPEIDFFKKVGPEPLEDEFKAKDFIKQMRRRNKSSVKAVLLDQTVVAGVGNIYADESLWAAKIHPETKVGDLSDSKLALLLDELKAVLLLSIEKGGSTDRNYVNAEGKKGSYISFAKVFRREGKPCSRCSTEVIKTRVAGRGTHICPVCQKDKTAKNISLAKKSRVASKLGKSK